jgi:hypothetical protein
MHDLNWRSIFDERNPKIALLLRDLENNIKENNFEVWEHLDAEEFVSMEASFSSQIITSFIYDAPMNIAEHVFECFLLEGEQALVDIIAGLVKLKSETILQLEEIALMNYLRKELILECFEEYTLKQIMAAARVDLKYLLQI